ncbi:phage integrase SAM-like domain-containing protein [Roseibium sp. TrichSKD4]|uniref:phage integrase SAM-like domain-containing protein n=1 Tax=Roseibium sp. TrichSKD4 TaxID=744980 RepID=UPI00058FBB03|nr:phage integrase SAM-like domain-containing protein [Roseibium sp. TrichSKD4]
MQDGNAKRRKLNAETLEDACAELIRDVEVTPAKANDPINVMFAAVVNDYRQRVLISKRKIRRDQRTGETGESISSTESGLDKTVERLVEFMSMKDADGLPRSSNGAAFTCGELTLKMQHAFYQYLAETYGLSTKSISIYMVTIQAALNKATIPYLKPTENGKIEVQILTRAPTIVTDDKSISEIIGRASTKNAQKNRPLLKFEEMARFIDSIKYEHAFRYVVIALNTWARPEAIHDLNFHTQIDMDYGLVQLNPEGRLQTKKYRPTIRLTNNLRCWAEYWNTDYPMQFRGQKVLTAKKPINAAFAAAGFPELSRKEIRAFMFTQSRRVLLSNGQRLSKTQRSEWIGHASQEGSSTGEFYERFDPEFLEEAMEATDLVIQEIQKHLVIRSLIAPVSKTGTNNVVKGNFGG